MLRKASPADLPAVRRLLSTSNLPLEGLDDHRERLWVWDRDGNVAGAVAFEAYGDQGLLRSLIVDPDERGTGLGGALLHAGLAEMRKAGLRWAYGLTTTIPDWLERLGWTEVPKETLPAALHQSMELRGACPDTARAFRFQLV